MATILVVAEQAKGQLKKPTFHALAAGQQLAQIGAQVAVEADRAGNAEEEDHRPEQRDPAGPAQRQRGPPIPEAVDARLHPAPCRLATASIDSRRSERPDSAVSRSMVSAGCRRMAWV